MRPPLEVLHVVAKAMTVQEGDVEAVRLLDLLERNVHRLSAAVGEIERLVRVSPAAR